MADSELVARYFESYPKIVIGEWSHCIYCGEPANVLEHLWPFSMLSPANRKLFGARLGPQGTSCRHCNAVLGSRYFDTLEMRCDYVSERLAFRAERFYPKWQESELQSLDANLKTYVQGKQCQREVLIQRINWFKTVDYYRNIESLQWEPTVQHDNPKFRQRYYDFFSSTLAAIRRGINAWQNGQRKTQDALRSRAISSPSAHGSH